MEEVLAELRLGLTTIENRLEDDEHAPKLRLTGYGVMPAEE